MSSTEGLIIKAYAGIDDSRRFQHNLDTFINGTDALAIYMAAFAKMLSHGERRRRLCGQCALAIATQMEEAGFNPICNMSQVTNYGSTPMGTCDVLAVIGNDLPTSSCKSEGGLFIPVQKLILIANPK